MTFAAVLLAYLAAYAGLAWRLRRSGGRVDPWRAIAFAAGLGCVGVALAAPLDARAEAGSLVAHMTQHELLLNVAPVLLLLGLEPRLLRPVTRAVLAPSGRRVLRWVGHPAVALVLYLIAMTAWYVPAVYEAVSASPWLHPAGHAFLVATGMAFWFAVLQPLPTLRRLRTPEKLAWLLAGSLAGAVVAAALIGAPEPLYGGTLADQRLAGGLMMAVEMPLALGAALWAVLRGLPRGEAPWPST